VVIYEDKLPMDPTAYQAAIDIGLEATMCITNGGEDYELLFTLHQDDYEKVKHSPDITVIGYCTAEAGSVKMISRQHNEYPLPAMGWEAI
jgi:thiamine-monophosphate kinase